MRQPPSEAAPRADEEVKQNSSRSGVVAAEETPLSSDNNRGDREVHPYGTGRRRRRRERNSLFIEQHHHRRIKSGTLCDPLFDIYPERRTKRGLRSQSTLHNIVVVTMVSRALQHSEPAYSGARFDSKGDFLWTYTLVVVPKTITLTL